MGEQQFKCYSCAKTLNLGPFRTVKVDAEEFPASAAWEHPVKYRLCRTCESQLTPSGKAGLERAMCTHLELTLRVKALAEEMRDQEFRTHPKSRKMAETAVQFHQTVQADLSSQLERISAYINSLQQAPVSAQAILGREWLESMQQLLGAGQLALQRSHAVTTELLRRLSAPPQEG